MFRYLLPSLVGLTIVGLILSAVLPNLSTLIGA